MSNSRNIVITDQTALHALMHRDWTPFLDNTSLEENPLANCAETLAELRAFNANNPIYGEKPVKLLIPKSANRRFTSELICRYASDELATSPPSFPSAFIHLDNGIYLTSPELTYLRMAGFVSEYQLAAIGVNLCGRYYIVDEPENYPQRLKFLTNPYKLTRFCKLFPQEKGSAKALKALRWITPNSASPAETKLFLTLVIPVNRGGFGLPFTHLNYDVPAGRLARIAEQSRYSIDIANLKHNLAVEYDGERAHTNPSKDKRRRNELQALGWEVFPIDKQTLWNPDRTTAFCLLLAKRLGIRMRLSDVWKSKHRRLRHDLGLPA